MLHLGGLFQAKGAERRRHQVLLVVTMALVGVFTGLLANNSGFLIVPLKLLIFGLTIRPAGGTSLLVISVLAVPTLAIHWALGTSTGQSSRAAGICQSLR